MVADSVKLFARVQGLDSQDCRFADSPLSSHFSFILFERSGKMKQGFTLDDRLLLRRCWIVFHRDSDVTGGHRGGHVKVSSRLCVFGSRNDCMPWQHVIIEQAQRSCLRTPSPTVARNFETRADKFACCPNICLHPFE